MGRARTAHDTSPTAQVSQVRYEIEQAYSGRIVHDPEILDVRQLRCNTGREHREIESMPAAPAPDAQALQRCTELRQRHKRRQLLHVRRLFQMELKPLNPPRVPVRHAELLHHPSGAVECAEQRQGRIADLGQVLALDDERRDARLGLEKADEHLWLEVRVGELAKLELVSFQDPPLHCISILPRRAIVEVFEDVEFFEVHGQAEGGDDPREVVCFEIELWGQPQGKRLGPETEIWLSSDGKTVRLDAMRVPEANKCIQQPLCLSAEVVRDETKIVQILVFEDRVLTYDPTKLLR